MRFQDLNFIFLAGLSNSLSQMHAQSYTYTHTQTHNHTHTRTHSRAQQQWESLENSGQCPDLLVTKLNRAISHQVEGSDDSQALANYIGKEMSTLKEKKFTEWNCESQYQGLDMYCKFVG